MDLPIAIFVLNGDFFFITEIITIICDLFRAYFKI